MISYILIGLAIVAGFFIVYSIANRSSALERKEREELAQQRALDLREDGRRIVEFSHREGEAQAKEERLKIEQSLIESSRSIEDDNDRLRIKLQHADERISKKQTIVKNKETEQNARFKELRLQRDANNDVRKEAKTIRSSYREVLEKRAEQRAEDIRESIREQLIDEVKSQSADLLRNLEQNAKDELDREAKRIMGISISRYSGHCPRERGLATMALEAGQADKFTADLGPIVEEISKDIDISIHLSEDGESLRFETGDGVGREFCRRVVARFLIENHVREPQKLIQAIRADLDREIMRLGKSALHQLKLKGADREIVELIGRLNWRTSYTQNQYHHAIEAGRLAGLMAAELNLDPMIARRVGLFHDIGKALSHQQEGSHALIGGEIARRVGEDEIIANAIAAHHGEEAMNSPYAWIAAASDALSGGRPGARREVVESYGDRIGDLERIASDFKGVHQVHAMQAGREIRVFVDEKRIKDRNLDDLSAEIADRISDEMVFPGQIRVTVIREFKAVSVAN